MCANGILFTIFTCGMGFSLSFICYNYQMTLFSNNEIRYKLSFTAIGLGLTESITVAEAYQSCHNWEYTKTIVKENNLLQSRTNRRNTRVVREVVHRLSCLSDVQLELLLGGTLEDQRLLLWFAICNYYKIIREFAIEVLQEKFLTMDMHLSDMDYQAFFLRKMEWHPELDEITESTQVKLRTVLFRMMREAGLLDDDNHIIRIIPSTSLSNALKSHAEFAYHIYPSFPHEFGGN